jgi:hypothetical protein
MPNTIKELCNKCGRSNHDILYHEKIRWTEDIDDEFSIDGGDTYDLLKCRGCDAVILRCKSWNSEELDLHTGRPDVSTSYFPPRTYRQAPRWLTELRIIRDFDDSVEDIVKEIYIALQNDAPSLAIMGIRALLEKIMIDKVGDQGSFTKNLATFLEKGFISTKQKDIIAPVLEAGHATIHRSFKPIKKDVALMMDITESIIETVYVNEYRAKGISTKIPARKKLRKKKSKRVHKAIKTDAE